MLLITHFGLFLFALEGRVGLQEELSDNAFDLLVKPVRRLVEQKGFLKPTEPQQKTIPQVLQVKTCF